MKNREKNYEGITLIALVITIIVLLVLAGIAISMVSGSNGILNKIVDAKSVTEQSTENEKISFAVSAALVEGKGVLTTDNLNKELQYNFNNNNVVTEAGESWVYKTDKNYIINEFGRIKIVNDWVFTKEFLEDGNINVSNGAKVEVKTYNIDGNEYAGLSITGRPNIRWEDGREYITWFKTIDLSDYNLLEFYVKKGQNHGIMTVMVDDKTIKHISYNSLSVNWTKYTLDISEYKGEHILSFAGGYYDSSGSSKSNTQYYNIILTN